MHVKVTGRLHLEAVHGLAGVRVYEVVAPGGHRIASPFLSFEPWLAYILAAPPADMRPFFMQILTSVPPIFPVYSLPRRLNIRLLNSITFITTKNTTSISSVSTGRTGASVASSIIGNPKTIAGKF